MAKHSAPHNVLARVRHVPGWNRGDLAILLCGVVGFLSLTFGAPQLNHGEPAVPAAETSSLTLATPSAVPWPLSAAGKISTPGAEAGSGSGSAESGAAEAVTTLPGVSPPLRVTYPAAAMDAAVHPLEPDASAVSTRTLVPPETMDGYWLTPFGAPGTGSDNTTYIIGHSWEGRDAPFNHLSTAATVGDFFDVVTATGTIRYRVDSVTTYVKSGLKDSAIWDMVPNRVVLISCYTEDPWGKNVVVSASPAVP